MVHGADSLNTKSTVVAQVAHRQALAQRSVDPGMKSAPQADSHCSRAMMLTEVSRSLLAFFSRHRISVGVA